MKDNEQDVFAQAAAQMHKTFPPRVQTVTQDKAELERLYPKGGDGNSVEGNRPMIEPRYSLDFTLDQLDELQTALETVSASEADPEAEIFVLLDQVRKARVDAIKFKQRNQERAADVLSRLADVQIKNLTSEPK